VRPKDAVDPLADHPWLRALEAEPFQPPAPDAVPRVEVTALVRRGLVVEADGLYFAPSALEEARQRLVALFAARPEGVGLGELRDDLGTSRKWALAVAAALDARGVTVRRGEVRLPGPRLGQPISPPSP
jgi:selenocysteine-specific elongation factor